MNYPFSFFFCTHITVRTSCILTNEFSWQHYHPNVLPCAKTIFLTFVTELHCLWSNLLLLFHIFLCCFLHRLNLCFLYVSIHTVQINLLYIADWWSPLSLMPCVNLLEDVGKTVFLLGQSNSYSLYFSIIQVYKNINKNSHLWLSTSVLIYQYAISLLKDKTFFVGQKPSDIYCHKTGAVLHWSLLYLCHIIHFQRNPFIYLGKPVFIKYGFHSVSSRVTTHKQWDHKITLEGAWGCKKRCLNFCDLDNGSYHEWGPWMQTAFTKVYSKAQCPS